MPELAPAVLTRFRVMAYTTGVVLVSSCLFALSFSPLYLGQTAAAWLWTAHGYLYIGYVIVAFHLALRAHWPLLKTLLVMAAGTVPLMSFVAERRVTRQLRERQLSAAPTA